jgi:hypothetical protein
MKDKDDSIIKLVPNSPKEEHWSEEKITQYMDSVREHLKAGSLVTTVTIPSNGDMEIMSNTGLEQSRTALDLASAIMLGEFVGQLTAPSE